MAIYLENQQTCVSGTEHTLSAATETEVGFFSLWVDLNDLTSGESLEVRLYEKADDSAGTQRVFYYAPYSFPLGEVKIQTTPAYQLAVGWKMTIEAVGTPVIPWSIRKD